MNALEKYAAKKALLSGLKKWISGAKSKAHTFLKSPKHKTHRRVAAGVAGAGVAALLAKKLIKGRAKGLSKASIVKLMKQHKGKLIAGAGVGAGAAGLSALLRKKD